MTGRQKEMYEALLEIASKVEDGFFGIGDNIDELAFIEDLDEITEEI